MDVRKLLSENTHQGTMTPKCRQRNFLALCAPYLKLFLPRDRLEEGLTRAQKLPCILRTYKFHVNFVHALLASQDARQMPNLCGHDGRMQ